MRGVLWCMAVAAAFGQSGGGIQGVVSDDSGKALGGAYILAVPLGSSGGLSSTAVSGAGGQFSFAQLRPANYMLCVQIPHTAYLDPCRWSTPAQVTVAAGQVSTSNLRVSKGAVVHVRLNDPGQHLAKGDGDVLLGIMTSSFFHPLHVAVIDGAGRTFDLAIPLNVALRLSVASGQLQLADHSGAALAAATSNFPIQQAAGQPDPTLTFTVTGKR